MRYAICADITLLMQLTGYGKYSFSAVHLSHDLSFACVAVAVAVADVVAVFLSAFWLFGFGFGFGFGQ